MKAKVLMNMKKIYTTIMMVLCAVHLLAGTEFTFTAAADMNQTKDGITVVIAQGNGQSAPAVTTDYETQKPEMRLYLGNTITVSSTEALKNIQLVCAKSSASNKDYAGLSAEAGVLESGGVAADKNDWKVDTWTGEATKVVFTLTGKGQRRIKQLVVNGDPVDVVDPEEQPLPTADDLDGSYEYSEPEIVHVPNTQFFHKEYAFIDGNILVHCGEGSIVKATDDEDAYFGVMENQKITFTANQVIKGIAIHGNVRKKFSASCDHGLISYLTDEDVEMAGDPVLVVRNIDNMSVTITCNKNLSCYGVRVYFQENPDPLDNETIEPETGVEHTHTDLKANKILRDGQLLIIRDGKTCNIVGTIVR